MISGIEEDPPEENNEKINHASLGCLYAPCSLFWLSAAGILEFDNLHQDEN